MRWFSEEVSLLERGATKRIKRETQSLNDHHGQSNMDAGVTFLSVPGYLLPHFISISQMGD